MINFLNNYPNKDNLLGGEWVRAHSLQAQIALEDREGWELTGTADAVFRVASEKLSFDHAYLVTDRGSV